MSNKVPQIRFNGYSHAWEERKLKELGDIQTGNTPPTSDSDNYSLDGVPWVTPTDIKSLVISNTAKKLSQVGVAKARIAKAGSILVTSIASIGKNTLLRMDAGFNQQINSLTPTSENDSYFLLTQSEKWSEKMKQTAASATMQIVNKTDFSNISTYVPVHKEEQEKIGSFFKQLDNTIALHQRKLDLLKEQKKGYLQKMFPKNGAKVPELRFAGFADDWEERKAKDLFIPVNERNREDLPVLSVTQDQGVVFRNDLAIDIKYDESTLSSYKVIHPGDFVISLRSFQGGFELSNVLGISSPAYTIFDFAVPAEQDKLYWKAIFKTFKFIESLKTVTFGIRDGKSISFKEFGDLKLNYPSDVDEQRRIGEFFTKLDDTIALHQRKLDLLKEQKKGFLQKMFV